MRVCGVCVVCVLCVWCVCVCVGGSMVWASNVMIAVSCLSSPILLLVLLLTIYFFVSFFLSFSLYYYLRQGGYVFASVSLCVCVCVCLCVCVCVCVCVCHQHCAKSYGPIITKILGRVRSGPRNNRLDFGGDLDHRLDTGFL